MHLIKNKELQRKITEYYLAAEANRLYLRDVNKVQSQMYELSTDIYPYKFLISLPKNHTVDLELIDTSWIGNPNSRTYLAVISYLNADLSLNNVYRRTVYQRTLVKADDLKKSLQEELKSRSN
jgi:coenzyme F420-reducing hydrogenase beta subunit